MKKIGAYRLVKLLGEGLRTEVYEVLAPRARLALKIAKDPSDQESSLSLKEEFRSLASIDHPNIVSVHDFGQADDGRFFFTMDLVKGRPFSRSFRSPSKHFYAALFQTLSALHHIHYQGFVHGDLKPDNLLVVREGDSVKAVLTDFGMARNLGVTAEPVPGGTILYMAPEILSGIRPDARSDLYSLGVLLYETLAGRSVVRKLWKSGLLKDSFTVELPPISIWVESIHPSLEHLLERMTRKRPENRPRDAVEIWDSLSQFAPTERLPAIDQTERPLLSSSLVGRQKELNSLEEFVKRASTSGNRFALITGPSGIGKSRLLKELRTLAVIEGMHILPVSCAKDDMRPLGPFSTLLEEAYPAEDPESKGLENDEPSSVRQSARRLELVNRRIETISEETGKRVLILIDDFELASHTVHELVDYLRRFCAARHGIALVAAARQDIWAEHPARQSDLTIVPLKPLSRPRSRKLVSNMLGARASRGVAQWIHEYSGGLPLLIEETVSWLRRDSLVVTRGNRCRVKWDELRKKKPPRTISGLIGFMVEGLEESEIELLWRASAIGDVFSSGVLAAVSKEYDQRVSLILRGLEYKNLILKERGDQYSFAHKWLSASLYQRANQKDRRALHRKILEVLESTHPNDIYELARHARAAGLRNKTVLYSIEAAREAMTVGSCDLAVQLFKVALSLLKKKDSKRRRVLENLADAQTWNGDYADAIKNLLSLTKEMRRRGDKARAVRKAALGYIFLDEPKEAARLLKKARDLTRGSQGEGKAWVLLLSGYAENNMQQYEEAQEYFRRALELATRLGLDDLISRAHTALGRIAIGKGDLIAARKSARQAVKAAEASDARHSLPRGLFLLASVEMRTGRLREAASHLNHVLELERKDGYLFGQGRCLAQLSMVQRRMGKMKNAMASQREALEIFEKLDDRDFTARAENNLGHLCDIAGDWRNALEHYAGALKRYESLENEPFAATCHQNIGLLLTLMGEFEEGEKHLKAATKLGSSSRNWGAILGAAEATSIALALQGKLDEALDTAREAVEFARGKGLNSAGAMLQLSEVYLMLGDTDTAAAMLNEASVLAEPDPYLKGKELRLRAQVFTETASDTICASMDTFEKTNDRFEVARTLLTQSELLARSVLQAPEGRALDQAAASSEEAIDIFRSLGAKPFVSIATRQIAKYKKMARDASDSENLYLRTIFAVNRMLELLTADGDLLDQILDKVIDILGAERGMVLLFDEQKNLVPAAGRNIDRGSEKDITQISQTVVTDVAASGTAAASEDASDDPRYMTMESVALHGIKSLLCVPLVNRGETLGALYVDHTLVRGLFTKYDDEFLMTVGNLLAGVIDKRRYIDKLKSNNIELKRLLRQGFAHENIIGNSESMRNVLKMIERFAPMDQSVLITGGKGTGKGLVAKALHIESPRREGPFVTLDATLIPAGLIEDTLFGHVRGAFSGAYTDARGLIESANRGTLFLDNCESIPLELQSKLVSPIESRAFRRLGSTNERKVDFRVVSATRAPLGELVLQGMFRFDLSVALRILEIEIPPLRDRGGDIYLLASHFLEESTARMGKQVRGFTRDALKAISSYSWPGNVSELATRIERSVGLSKGGVISRQDLGFRLPESPGSSLTLKSSKTGAEFRKLTAALTEAAGNVTDTASLLGISRRHVQRLLKKHGLNASDYRAG